MGASAQGHAPPSREAGGAQQAVEESLERMQVALPLGGTDRGCSGIGTYVRAIAPRLNQRLVALGGRLIALGTPSEIEAYSEELRSVETVAIPRVFDGAAASALFHLAAVGTLARRAGANVLLLPAANRRMTLRSPIPTVGVVHDLAQLHVAEKYDPLRMFYVNRVLTRAFRSSTELVTVSSATRDDLARVVNGTSESVRVVLNGVDAELFQPRDRGDVSVVNAIRSVGLEPTTDRYLLYVSRLEHPGKNHIRLLQAFARSAARRTHRLVLVGKDWGAGAQIAAERTRLQLNDRVTIAGFVSDAVLRPLLAGSDAVVMVGLREGFGLPALEALAAGRPVIAADAGALPEVVGPLAALCDPLDVGSIARAIDRALNDDALRDRIEREGPAWAAERGWDRTADGLLEACVSALASGGGR